MTPRETSPSTPRRRRTLAADYVRASRRELGLALDARPWSQRELADVLGLPLATVAAWESDRNPISQLDLDHLARLRYLAEHGADPRAIRGPDATSARRRLGSTIRRGAPPKR